MPAHEPRTTPNTRLARVSEVARILSGQGKQGSPPPLWDGHTAERIAAILMEQ